MQQLVGGYLVKRIEAEIFRPPAARPEPDAAAEPATETAGPDRIDLTDERGRAVGTAYRLPGVAVYVVSDGHAHRQDDLDWSLRDPDSRLFVLRDGGAIAALVYAPARTRRPRKVEALRADEV
jgi:hypothetical protein